ncbi:MAG: hypothetical protein WC846_05285 [Candidatus Gracilibacteria bacterium]|jgi:hypothetical protein
MVLDFWFIYDKMHFLLNHNAEIMNDTKVLGEKQISEGRATLLDESNDAYTCCRISVFDGDNNWVGYIPPDVFSRTKEDVKAVFDGLDESTTLDSMRQMVSGEVPFPRVRESVTPELDVVLSALPAPEPKLGLSLGYFEEVLVVKERLLELLRAGNLTQSAINKELASLGGEKEMAGMDSQKRKLVDALRMSLPASLYCDLRKLPL